MDKRPNLLVIMSDQHAANALGAMGHPAVISPHLDALAARGVTFTQAYCPYPMCTPARASFMTGRLTPDHGVWELGSPLRTDLPTWAHVLRSAGYATTLAGRMHFVGHDKLHGFERRVAPECNRMLSPFAYGPWEGPQEDQRIMTGAVQHCGPQDGLVRMEVYDMDVTTAARDELRRLADEEERPWALMVGLLMPHIPYAVSRPYYDRYEGVEIPMPAPPPDGRSFEESVPPMLEDCRKWLGLTSDGATDDEVRMARRCYYGMITHLDDLVGELVRELEALGMAENTWVVYTSDHGDNLGEHGFWSKLNFYEASVGVPLIVAPPDCAAPGSKCAAPVSLIDWMPTLMELSGAKVPFGPLPGRSLLPLLAEPSARWEDRVVISDYACDGTRVPMRMVRRGPWKAWFAPGFAPLLFNVEEDPGEWRDLAAEAGSWEILRELRAVAEADGWDGEALTAELVDYKRRLVFIGEAEERT